MIGAICEGNEYKCTSNVLNRRKKIRNKPFGLIIRHNTRQIELELQQYLCFEEVSQRSAQVPTGLARTFAVRGTNIRVALLCYL